MSGSRKWYVVWVGHVPGVYATWEQCVQQTRGFSGAKFRAFPSQTEAEQAYREGHMLHWGVKRIDAPTPTRPSMTRASSEEDTQTWIIDSISVDVGTHGNPGKVEYRGVETATGALLFSSPDIPWGTNNLGEFVAIVHGLAYLHQQGRHCPIYTDSRNALLWVRQRAVSTTLPRNDRSRTMWMLVDRALAWLQEHPPQVPILKWNTRMWGEIKADYQRK